MSLLKCNRDVILERTLVSERKKLFYLSKGVALIDDFYFQNYELHAFPDTKVAPIQQALNYYPVFFSPKSKHFFFLWLIRSILDQAKVVHKKLINSWDPWDQVRLTL